MKNLSYTQEYYLCAINEKGGLSFSNGTRIDCAFFAGALMELLEHGFVKFDENECIVTAKTIDGDYAYIKPLYDFIATQKKPATLKDLGANWMVCFKLKNKTWDELRSAIGLSLVNSGHAIELTGKGLIEGNARYAPKPETVKPIIEKIRAEFLEDGNITNETICLAALLDGSRIIGDYFSKFEADELKKRLEEIRNSEAFSMLNDVLERIMTTIIAAIV